MERAPSLKSAGDERTSREPTPTSSRGDGKDGLKPSRPPCRFFLLGKCKFGDACTFSHDGRIPICTFFEQKGSCRYGNSCKFLHNSPGAGSAEASAGKAREGESIGALGSAVSTPAASGAGAATTASNQAAVPPDAGECCGICLENIPAAGKRFGLLNCDHVFCVDCLRKWRKSRGPQKDISRTCPECRKVSFFVVPSKEHLKGKAKLKAIQAYKKGLSKLPCKYHKADGSTVCPFGAGCFYAHFDENGVDVKSRSPPAQPVPRRTCPYLRNRGRGGGGGGGGGGGSSSSTGGGAAEMGGRGAAPWGLEDFPDSFSIEDEVILHDVDGDHISFIMRLQQLMMLADEL